MPLIAKNENCYENSAGTGFGNKTTPGDSSFDTSSTRFGSTSSTNPYSGGTQHGSGTTGGAGLGNKMSNDPDVDTSDTRFGSSGRIGAYNGETQYGSGSTGGAGYGNKHTNRKDKDIPHDSTMGKLYEKAGGVLKNEGMAEKGHEKRKEAGAFERQSPSVSR